MTRRRLSQSDVAAGLTMVLLLAGVIGLQAVRERWQQLAPQSEAAGHGRGPATTSYLYVSSPEVVTRAALSYRSLLADVYWMRALQHFGRTRLAAPGTRNYDLLFPLLELTTSLDPNFNVAYRFGAIFLGETPPSGPGRPDQAVRLLEKGLAAKPSRWEYAQDIGFVYYRQRDYASAAAWFGRAAAVPGAPTWLSPLEAVTRARGGDRDTARRLWSELLTGSDTEDNRWLRNEAARRLRQLDVLDRIDALSRLIGVYEQRTGSRPATWADLIRAGYLPGTPVDPDGYPMQLNPYWGLVTLDPNSVLNPLPTDEDPVP